MLLLIVRNGWLTPLTRNLANVGRTAFSNYILTSLICQMLFVWGPWKLYGTLEYYQQLYVVGGVWIVNFIASALWLRVLRLRPSRMGMAFADLLGTPALKLSPVKVQAA